MCGMRERQVNEMEKEKKLSFESVTGVITLILSVFGLSYYLLGFSTGYYTFGQMKSTLTFIIALVALAAESVLLVLKKDGKGGKVWKYGTYLVTGTLVAAALLIVGDRVEGIGNCIVTDFDSGHGGEQAIYLSIGGALLLLGAAIFNIIGSFSRETDASDEASLKKSLIRQIITSAAAFAVAVGVLVPVSNLGFAGNGKIGGSSAAEADAGQTVYKITFSQNNGNVDKDTMPDYQFLPGSLGGVLRADARQMMDVTLTLDGKGGYQIFVDDYVVDSGKRCEVGDDTGFGSKIQTTAEGTYTMNDDGTITTSKATHVKYEMETDTYSSQIKDGFGLQVDGVSDDGVYDSQDHPSLLDIVPETIWEVDDGTMEIKDYHRADEESSETESSETESLETESSETESSETESSETESSDTSDNNDTESAEDDGKEESGKSNGPSFESDDKATTLTFEADGTYIFALPAQNVEDKGKYTFDGETLVLTNAKGLEMKSEGDPAKLHYVSSLSDQLVGDFTIDLSQLKAKE